jgi:hypothetical protein
MGRIMQTCVLLHARILGRADPTAEDRLGAATLIAQVAFFRSNHAAVLNLMGWSSIAADELEVIKHRLHQNFARILGVNHE